MNLLLMTMLAATLVDPDFPREFAETRRYNAGRPTSAKATPDGKTVFFLRSQPKDNRLTLFELDVATGAVKELLTPDALLKGAAETLTTEEKARLERQRITSRGFTSYQLSKDGERLLVTLSGRLYVYSRADGKVSQLKTGEGASIDPRFTPDGARVAYVRGEDLYVCALSTNTERRVTTGGTPLKPHALAEFIAQEEMDRSTGYWFSPDGKLVAFQETDHTGVDQLSVMDPMHPEREVDRFYYPRAGTKNAAVKLGITPVGGGKTTWVKWDDAAFPYLATVRWPKKGALSIVVQNREQTKEQLLAVDPKTGKTSLLVAEEDEAWLNLFQAFPLWLADGSGFFWATERNGGPEVELRGADGTPRGTWVKRAAGFAELAGYDDATSTLYFTGGPEPTESYVHRVKKGGAPERVKTAVGGEAWERATLSEGGTVLLVGATTSTAMVRRFVVPTDNSAAIELPSVAVEPTLKPNVEVKKLVGANGSYVALLRPKDFVAGKKYPVILSVYGGPGHQMVTRSPALEAAWYANQGFLVVSIDGRGTPRRGRDWERAIKGDFATLIAADQLAGLRELARTVPELDLARVGVIGWSFGGYLAGLLTLKGDGVKAGIAGAPVVDWRDYDTHYTERYLGLPEQAPKAYEVSSLLTYVPESKRPLVLLHGTADDNVYFLHTLKLSDALFKAGKPHTVLPLTNFTHLVPDPLVSQRLSERIVTIFKETL